MPEPPSPPPNPVPVLIDFLNAVPPPLTAVLVGLAPHIAHVRHTAELLSWKAPWDECWLALAAWWAVCLFADSALRYLLPIAILFTLVLRHWTTPPRTAPTPVTEHSLATTITDLTSIQSLLSSTSTFNPPLPPVAVLLRVLAILYLPYLFLTYFIRLRVIVAFAGTVLLTWGAPWARLTRRLLWRSAFLRWTIYRAYTLISGLPPSVPLPPPVEVGVGVQSAGDTAKAIRFLLTVYENQRWWMGLDWTAALLPAERPAWCSATQEPVSPPNAFALPSPTTVVLDSGRVRRTATWAWEESEWRVVVRKEGSGAADRVERPLPSGGAEPAGSRLLKAAGRMRSPTEDGERGVEEGSSAPGGGEGDEVATDGDGWVYGDNKWEGASSKGGIGKVSAGDCGCADVDFEYMQYTRYRQWTRIAVLSETIEGVEAGEGGAVGMMRGSSVSSSASSTVVDVPSEAEDSGSRLRQRLRAIAADRSPFRSQ